MGDVYEAIMGAILLDSGWDLTQMWQVCVKDLELSEEQLTILKSNLDAIKEIEEAKAKANVQKYFLDQVSHSDAKMAAPVESPV